MRALRCACQALLACEEESGSLPFTISSSSSKHISNFVVGSLLDASPRAMLCVMECENLLNESLYNRSKSVGM